MSASLANRSRGQGQHRRLAAPDRPWRRLTWALLAIALFGGSCVTLISLTSSQAGTPQRPGGQTTRPVAAASPARAAMPPLGDLNLAANLTASATLIRLNETVILTAHLPDLGPLTISQGRLEIDHFDTTTNQGNRQWRQLEVKAVDSPLGATTGTAVESFTFHERGLYQIRMVLQVSTSDADLCVIQCGNVSRLVTTNEVEIQVVGDQVLALTFDDGPGQNHTLEVLQALEQGGAKATFFLVCSRLESLTNQAVARQTLAEGHQIGSHRWDHEYASTLMNPDEFTGQLDKCDDIFARTLGFKPTIFRFPWGYGTSDQQAEVKARGMDIYGWDYATGDGTTHEDLSSFLTNLIANKVIRNAKSGDVILLHDAPNHANTAAAVPLILDDFAARGFDFVTVDGLAQLGYSHREDFDPTAY